MEAVWFFRGCFYPGRTISRRVWKIAVVNLLHRLSPAGSALARTVNIADLRHLAHKRAPRPVFDYVDGGADDEVTLRDNRRSWDEILFRPRNAVHVSQPDLRVSVLGCECAMPFRLLPISQLDIPEDICYTPCIGDSSRSTG